MCLVPLSPRPLTWCSGHFVAPWWSHTGDPVCDHMSSKQPHLCVLAAPPAAQSAQSSEPVSMLSLTQLQKSNVPLWTDSLHRTRPGTKYSNQPPYCMFQSLVPIILCVLPEATMSAKPCCVSRLSSDVCGDFIVANIEDEYSAFTLIGIQWKLQYTVAVDKTSFYLFSYFSF